MLDLLVILFLILTLINSNKNIGKKYGLSSKYRHHLDYLLFYHLFFSLFFTWYILNFGGDSQGYWRFVMEQVVKQGETTWFSYFGEGTTFILWLCYIPSQLLGLSYLTGNILFGFLGFIGIRYLFILVAIHFPSNHKVLNIPLFPTVFYFLNLHFWTAGVGKDAICFWGIAWFVFSLQQYKKYWWQVALAFFFVYMARPHVGQALITGAAFALLLGSEIKLEYKIALATLSLGASNYLSSTTLEVLKLDEFSITALGTLADSKIGNLNTSHVGSGIALESYSLPLRLFTYLFRPLFFDAHNIVSFFSSFENLLYLWLSLFVYKNCSPEAIRDMPLFLKVGIIVFIPITLAFMSALSNLGIIMRMKNMTMIYYLLFCFYLIGYNKKLHFIRAMDRRRFFQKRQEIIDRKNTESADTI